MYALTFRVERDFREMESGNEEGEMTNNGIPSRDDRDYVGKVLSTGVNQPDLAAMDEAARNEAVKKDLMVCEQLVGAWADCDDVIKDCRELLDAAHAEMAKAKNDPILVHSKLVRVRERLVQASRSRRSTRCVALLTLWLVAAFCACVLAIWKWHLLPGLQPKLKSVDPNIVFLLSSFLIGAIGGIFDAAWSLSKRYAEARFDPDHWLWHTISPFLGGILGAVVFVAFLAGRISTEGAGTATENVTDNASALVEGASDAGGLIPFSVRNALVLFIGFLAGFKQITVVDWIDGIAAAIFKRKQS